MRGEVGETYWGGACDSFCIFGFGPFRDESTEKKIVGLVRVMRGGWSVESYERWVTSETQVQRREERNYCWSGESYERWVSSIFLGWEFGWVLRHEGEHKEKRRDEMTVQRRGDKIFKKKLISSGSIDKKKLSKRVSFYYEFSIRNVCSVFKITSAHILKHRVQTMVFQQQFPNNSILNWRTKHIILPFGH